MFFRLGPTRLLLERTADTAAAGSVLYFEVSEIHQACDALERRGVRFDSAPQRVHTDDSGTFGEAGTEEWMAFFRDPDGNTLALVSRVSPSDPVRRRGGNAVPREELRDHIRQLEEQLLDPAVRRSPDAAGELLADGFLEFASSGRRLDRTRVLAALAAEGASAPLFRLSDFDLTILGLESVLAHYRVEAQHPAEAEPRHSLRSSLWVLRSGRWQMLFHQGTPSSAASPAAGPDAR